MFAASFKHRNGFLTMVPMQFTEVYASRALLEDDTGQNMTLYGKVTSVGMSNLDGDVTTMDRASRTAVLLLRQYSL
jgi:hypothetical protein